MKSVARLLLPILVAISTAGCQDFLEEDNKSNIIAQNYFANAEGYETLVNAAYSSLRDVWGDDPWLVALGVDIYTRGESELVSGSYENRDVRSSELNEYKNLNSTNAYVDDFYRVLYSSIQICNTAIERGATVRDLSDERKERLLAEVRFIRAYYYYLLVEQFGAVPLVTEEIKDVITHFERKNEEDVYHFIVSELQASLVHVPEVPEQFGRVTSGAVKNLLALVHLTRGYKPYASSDDFLKAASVSDDVINSGNYALLQTFRDVFTPGNEANDEIIFSIQYDPGLVLLAQGNGQSAHWGWELWTKEAGFERENPTYNWKKSQFTPTQFLYSLFNTSIDSRYDATFLSEFYATTDVPTQGVEKGDLKVFFPKWDEEFTAAEEADLKADYPAVSVYRYETWKQDIENVGGSGRFPMVWKFYDPKSQFHGNTINYSGTRDIFLFRLAETYLIAAEAYHKLGDNSMAAARINEVRRRAAIPGNETSMEIQPGDVDLDFILDERARELTGEYKRWMDLKRTGKLIERTLLHNNLAAREKQLNENHLLRPIPQSVIDQDSGNFPQNPGYN